MKMGGYLFQARGVTVVLNKFINEIKYLFLTLRKHAANIFEYKSKVNLKVSDTFRPLPPKKCPTPFGISPALGVGHLVLLFLLLGCGSSSETNLFDASISTQAPPLINRANPISGRVGDTITIFGFGFSNGAANNIVTGGGQPTTAATYALVANPTSSEIEQLTFTIPTGAATGAGNLFVTVFENTSNTISFTVNP